MNTFQHQYLSVLGTIAGGKFLKAAGKIGDDWIEQNTGKNLSVSKDGVYEMTESTERWMDTGITPEDASIMDDIAERGLKSMPKGGDRDFFRDSMETIQNYYRGREEEMQGLKARAEAQQAVVNKWAAKPHISKRQMKQFRKDIGGKQ